MQTKKFFAFGLILSAIFFVFNACTKQENEITTSSAATTSGIAQMKVENGRIAFKNSDEFFKLASEITNKPEEELDAWEKQVGFNSLRKELHQFYTDDKELTSDLKKLENFNFPNGHLSLLNAKGECLICDTIVVYLDGFKHFVPNKDENMLANIRSNPRVSQLKGTAGGKILPSPQVTSNSLITLGSNQIVATYQKQFQSQMYQGSSSVGPKKFIHELVSWAESRWPADFYFHAKLFVRSKLEYNSRGTWKEAGEYRRITYSMTSVYSLVGTSVSGTTNSASPNPFVLARWGYEILINEQYVDAYSYTWNVSVTGTISQIMDGDVQANFWQSPVSPSVSLW